MISRIYFGLLIISLTAVMHTAAADNNAMDTQTKSNGGKSIQSLIEDKKDVANAVAWWNKAYVATVAATAVIAVLVFVAQRKVIRKSDELSGIQEELMAEKDRLGAKDSKDKDFKINASIEKQRELENKNLTLQSDISASLERVGQLEKDKLVLQNDLFTAAERIASLNLKAEELHKENLELEEALSPRIFKDQSGASKALLAHSGTKFSIICVADAEARRTGGQIAQVLIDAKWEMVERKSVWDDFGFGDGVVVRVGSSGSFQMYKNGSMSDPSKAPDVMNFIKISSRTRNIAESAVAEFNRCGIDCTTHAADDEYPENVVVVRVGMKPNAYANRRLNEPNPGNQNVIVEGNRVYIPPPAK